MTWNYRIAKRQIDNISTGSKDTIYNIVEAYYDSNGKIWGITDACWPQGETLEELKADLDYYIQAIIYPVIDAESIPEPGAINPLDEFIENGKTYSDLEELAKELRNNES